MEFQTCFRLFGTSGSDASVEDLYDVLKDNLELSWKIREISNL